MALSMDEQRILAEIERQLAADDPRLASRLSRFGYRRLGRAKRTPRHSGRTRRSPRKVLRERWALLIGAGMLLVMTTTIILTTALGGTARAPSRPTVRAPASSSAVPATLSQQP